MVCRCFGRSKPDGTATTSISKQTTGEQKLAETVASLDDLQEGEEQMAEAINTAFAKLVNSALRRRPGDEAIKKLLASNPRPSNVPNLVAPRTNPEVWEHL